MSEGTATALLVLVIAAFGWIIFRVISTLEAGGPSAKEADYAALGGSSADPLRDDRLKH